MCPVRLLRGEGGCGVRLEPVHVARRLVERIAPAHDAAAKVARLDFLARRFRDPISVLSVEHLGAQVGIVARNFDQLARVTV